MCINSILFKMDNIRRQVLNKWLLISLIGIIAIAGNCPVNGYKMQRTLSGCYYNGTNFMEKSVVPTLEPCLICKCVSKTLICALKICPEQPIPPPRGCVLVHKNGACCPYLQCSKLHQTNKHLSDRRKIQLTSSHLDNYDKTAKDKIANANSYLRRSDDDDFEEDAGVCIVNGTVYKAGSAMASSTLCSYCYCIGGKQKCVKPKCSLPSPRCTPIYVDSACCPIKYDCSGKDSVKSSNVTKSQNHIRRSENKHYLRNVERGQRSNGCLVAGYFYPEGQKLPSQDPCEVCFCIRGDRKCAPKKCAPAIKNCMPRVPRGECCAVSYDCKHNEKIYARQMEDEQDSFDFFSILFGPDPDEPKPVPKNTTEKPTELTEVNATTEKSFFDFIRAGLELIDTNPDEDHHFEQITTTEKVELILNTTKTVDVPQNITESSTPNTTQPSPAILLTNSSIYNQDERDRYNILEENVTRILEAASLVLDQNTTIDIIEDNKIELTTLTPKVTTSTTTTTTEKPSQIDVIIKYDGPVNKSTVASLISSLNAKIVNITTTIPPSSLATKRTNNKFAGSDKVSSPVVYNVVTPSVNHMTDKPSIKFETIYSETFLQNAETTTTDIPSTTEYETTTLFIEDDETTTENEETTTVTEIPSTDYPETTTDYVTSTTEPDTTIVYETTTDGAVIESKTEIMPELTTIEDVTTTTVKPKTVVLKNNTKPGNKDSILSVFFSELSNIFDASRNESSKINIKNNTIIPLTPQPEPELNLIGNNKVNRNPSILETDYNYDYSEPTLPPSLPNLKIIPFLPADAVKKSENANKLNYDYYKLSPTNYPIITESYDSLYGLVKDHDLHTSLTFKSNSNKNSEYDVIYDPTVNYPAITENYDEEANNKNNMRFNTKFIRDKYDTISDDYDYENSAVSSYDLNKKQEKFNIQNDLKKFIQNKYDHGYNTESSYMSGFEKFGTVYPDKNVYYHNDNFDKFNMYPEKYDSPVFNSKIDYTENPLFNFEEGAMSGFSPPTKTEGGFLPKEPTKEEFYYDSFHTTIFPIDITTEDPAKGHENSFNANPFKDVIKTEPAPDLYSLIEDKEKLLSTRLASNNYSSIDILNETNDGNEFEKHIISITTDVNYAAENIPEESDRVAHNGSVPNIKILSNILESIEREPSVQINLTNAMNMQNEENNKNATNSEVEASGMFSLENVFNFLFREEEPVVDNNIKNTNKSTTLTENIPQFKNVPTRIAGIYNKSATSLDEDLTTRKIILKAEEKTKNETKELYTPSLSDLPFLNPNFHKQQSNPESKEDLMLPEFKNNIDRLSYNSDNYPDESNISNTESYVINPVDINKLKQHQSEGAAEILTKSTINNLKDTVGILKLAGCNIYGRMYRVGRIISELSGPCLECKCTEVGVHCTPLNC